MRYKIYIDNEDHCKLVQELLFNFGYGWSNERDGRNVKIVKYIGAEELYLNKDKYLTYNHVQCYVARSDEIVVKVKKSTKIANKFYKNKIIYSTKDYLVVEV